MVAHIVEGHGAVHCALIRLGLDISHGITQCHRTNSLLHTASEELREGTGETPIVVSDRGRSTQLSERSADNLPNAAGRAGHNGG